MKSSTGWPVGLVLCSLLIACGGKNEQYVNSAPKAEVMSFTVDTAAILDGSFSIDSSNSLIANFLATHPEAQARTIHESTGQFEIRNISREELEAWSRRPESIATNNRIQIKTANTFTPKDIQIAATPITTEENVEFDVPNATPFSKCVKATTKPTITIGGSENLKTDAGIPTVELGKEIQLSASLSKPHITNIGSKLRYVWQALKTPQMNSFPKLSELKPFNKKGSGVSFKPDMVGTYTLMVLVQDNHGVCETQIVPVVVTNNPAYDFKAAQGAEKSVDLKHFSYLEHTNAKQAWKNSQGEGLTIAILDTGVNYNHPAIIKNIKIKTSEKTVNGKDSDNNKFIDDYMGWDFVNGDNSAYDDEGHGSHVAGLAASSLIGIAPKAKVLPIKVLNGAGGGDIASIAAGIFYAADNGADIMNLSLGNDFKKFEIIKKAMDYAESKNVLIVAAAGNGDAKGFGYDLDKAGTQDIFPAEFNNSNLLVVAATDKNHQFTRYSNFGPRSVDVAAPGGTGKNPLFSLSTGNPKGHGFLPSSGTSMASPIVAGAAALTWAANPRLTAVQVKQILSNTGTSVAALRGKIVSGKVINANAAVLSAVSPLPRP